MTEEFNYVENFLRGEDLSTEYLHFIMEQNAYLELDDPDVYVSDNYEADPESYEEPR